VVIGHKGEKLCECLFNDPVAFFLLQGEVDCHAGLLKKHHIAAESREAATILNQQLPKGGVISAAVDNTAILVTRKRDINDTRAQNNAPLVHKNTTYAITEMTPKANDNEEDEDNDWMSRLLQSPLFHHLDPAKIQKLFTYFKEKDYRAGETVIRAGDHDKFFYVLKTGKAEVIIGNDTEHKQSITIDVGAFFGEGAIVGEAVHSATIKMLTDGIICCIDDIQFDELLKNTLLLFTERETMEKMMHSQPHAARLIDVRYPVEYRHSHTEGSINVPINVLRNKIKEGFAHATTYFIDHGDDKRSHLAALILVENGFKAILVK